jgi:hypothetical protein
LRKNKEVDQPEIKPSKGAVPTNGRFPEVSLEAKKYYTNRIANITRSRAV